MPTNRNKRVNLLVLRSWFASYPATYEQHACAHIEGLVMTHATEETPRCYAELRIPWIEADIRGLRREGFRFRCQVDTDPKPYGRRWGYIPTEHFGSEIFTGRDLEKSARSMGIIRRAMDRMAFETNAGNTLGHYVTDLARALKLDGVALLDTNATGSFSATTGLSGRYAPREYDQAIRGINQLAEHLRQGCVERARRVAA